MDCAHTGSTLNSAVGLSYMYARNLPIQIITNKYVSSKVIRLMNSVGKKVEKDTFFFLNLLNFFQNLLFLALLIL
jgi:hypothetical protein